MAFDSARDINMSTHLLYASHIYESESAHGVYIDGATIKDAALSAVTEIGFSGDALNKIVGSTTSMYLYSKSTAYVYINNACKLEIGATAITSSANFLVGINGIGYDNPVLTFAAGAAGTATFTGAVVATAFTIGMYTLSDSEFGYLDGQNQYLQTTSAVTFQTASAAYLYATSGAVYVGVNDSTNGGVICYGAGSGTAGGSLTLYTSAAHDDSIDYYEARVTEDDLLFKVGSTTKLTLQGSDGTWLFAASVGMGANTLTNCGNITMNGASTVDGVDVSAIPTTYLALAGGTMAGNITMGANLIYFWDAAVCVYSAADTYLDLVADGAIRCTAPNAAGFQWIDSGGSAKTITLGGGAGGNVRINSADPGTARTLELAIQATAIITISGPTNAALNIMGDAKILSDTRVVGLGAGSGGGTYDAKMHYNGSNLILDPDVIGSGVVYIGATADDDIWFANARVQTTGKIEFNDAGTYIYSQADSNLDYVADGAHRFAGYATFGANATGHALAASGDVLVSGYLEVDSIAYFDNDVIVAADAYACMHFKEGTSYFGGMTASTTYDQFGIYVGTVGGNQLMLSLYGMNVDHDHALQTSPTLFIHSPLSPDTSNNQWGSLAWVTDGFLISTGVNVGTGTGATTNDNYIRLAPRGTLTFEATGAGSIVCGAQAALATDATDGFLYIPTCAGVPTGVPTAYTGKVAIIFDTTNHDLYFYDAGWIKVEPA